MNREGHIAARVARAQDMLGRLDEQAGFDSNYTAEKLTAAAVACIEALALAGVPWGPEHASDVDQLAADAWMRGHRLAQKLERQAVG